MPETSGQVIIVGGGISGLSAAYELTRAEVPHILIEKQPRVGGVIETREWEGCVLECGPDSFISQKPAAMALIEELGLGGEVIGSKDGERKTYILRKRRLVELPEGVTMFVPTKPGPVLRSPLIGWFTKIRMGLETFRGPKSRPERTVAQFVTDHFGRETLNYLAEPLLAGVYGGDPEQLSASATLPRFVEMERLQGSIAKAVMKSREKAPPNAGPLFRTLRGGLGTLTAKLAEKANVQYGEASALERTEHGWKVLVGDRWIEGGHAILACPAYAAGALVRGLDESLAGLLEGIPYSSCAIATLIFRETEFDGMRAGSGFLVPKVERDRLLACTYMGTKFPDRVPGDKIALRCFFGGISDAQVLELSDEGLVALALNELRVIVGLTAQPIHTEVSRWPRSMAQYTVGHGRRVLEIFSRVAALPGLYVAGNAYTGIGIPDCIRMGRAAAKKVVQGRPRKRTANS